jgi:hypothetical protein
MLASRGYRRHSRPGVAYDSCAAKLLVDAAAEVEGVDEFFDEADDYGDHGMLR